MGQHRAAPALKPGDDMTALGALLIGHVPPDSLGTPFSSALGTLRSVFEEMDRWEYRRSFRS
jgi:hypothetical protein